MLEETIQEVITEALEKRELSIFNVIFTRAMGDSGAMSITFYLRDDMDYFLGPEVVNYGKLFDREGIMLFPEASTVVFYGQAISQLKKLLS